MVDSLAGKWQVTWDNNQTASIYLPGTLDSNNIGFTDVMQRSIHPDQELGFDRSEGLKNERIRTRLTRKKTYEGRAIFETIVDSYYPNEKRVFLKAERARCLKLYVEDQSIPHFVPPTLSSPHVFEVSNFFEQPRKVTLVSDNTYPDMPYDGIVYSSTATNETQTNWNGILGVFQLIEQEQTFIYDAFIKTKHNQAYIKVGIDSSETFSGELIIDSIAFNQSISQEINVHKGRTFFEFEVELSQSVSNWDILEGYLYELNIQLSNGSKKTLTFGVRDFTTSSEGYFELNGRRLFIRSETNCCIFPEIGHPPMTVEEWRTIIKTYQTYGVNLIRFHSYCPPEAAFIAADQLGMLMQPELSYWNPIDAFESDESYHYYKKELEQIILTYSNHPSFVMLSFGNELHASTFGHKRMNELLRFAKKIDETRLYTNGSNNHYGRIAIDLENDYYTSSNYFENRLRGTYAGAVAPSNDSTEKQDKVARVSGYLNEKYPDAKTNFSHGIKEIRKSYLKPILSFEVGQFEVLPDFDEIASFKGVTDPDNYRIIQEKVIARGMSERWKEYVEATGELSNLAYREEIEAAYRTKELAGMSLLGLQDFPGQGTALVGMLNAHLVPKPFKFAQPERFNRFFRDQIPLVLLEKYTYSTGEQLTAEVQLFNYGKKTLRGEVNYTLKGSQSIVGNLGYHICPPGDLYSLGQIIIELPEMNQAETLELIVAIDGCENRYKIWVYPNLIVEKPNMVYETKVWNEKVKEILENGGRVYLTPDANVMSLPTSIPTQFTTDFWSVGTFTGQSGNMGQYIDVKHPVFNDFPTNKFSEWQWWPMASQRAIVLPDDYESIITEIDSYAYLRPMTKLIEFKYGKGKLLLSSMALHELQEYPEAKALLRSIYRYMASDLFAPSQEINEEELSKLVASAD